MALTRITYMTFFIGLLWISLFAKYIAQSLIDPALPADILSYINNFPTHTVASVMQYAFIILLAITSRYVWLSKNQKPIFWLGSFSLMCFAKLLTGPVAQYQWFSLFDNVTIVCMGILTSISFKHPIKANQKKIYLIISSILITYILNCIISSITYHHLPASFIRFEPHTESCVDEMGIILLLFQISLLITLLFNQKKIIKHAYTIICFFFLIILNFYPEVYTGWDAFFGSISIFLNSYLIGLLYLQISADEAFNPEVLHIIFFTILSGIAIIKFTTLESYSHIPITTPGEIGIEKIVNSLFFIIFAFLATVFPLLKGITLFFSRESISAHSYGDKLVTLCLSFKNTFIVFFISLIGILIYFSPFIYNQYNVKTSIEIVKGEVTRLSYESRSISSYKHHYVLISIAPNHSLEINDIKEPNLYRQVNIGDKVLIKRQKGRLGYYYALQLNVLRTNYQLNL